MQSESVGEGEILLKKYASRHLSDSSDSEDGSMLQFTQIELEEQHLTQPVVEENLSSKGSPIWGSCYVVMASVMASLGGILFGYDIGIISGAVLQLKVQFCLSCLQQEMVISSMLVGAIFGSLVGGFFIDSYGRRLTIIINAVVFVIGAAILGLSPNYTFLLIGRLIVGFAVSISATGECIYISEIAPAKKRGLLVSLNELGITLGLLMAYLVNFLFIQLNNGWRYMFILSAIPAVVQGIGMMFLPKSPRYLMLKREEKQAKEVLQKLRGTQNVDTELVNIRISISTEKNHSCIELFSKLDNMRGRMLIGAGLVFFQQFTGQPSVLYYAPTIFEAIGFETNSAATLATVGLGIVKVVMTIIALSCVDKWGRRKFLFTGALLMGIGILLLGLLTHLDHHTVRLDPCKEHISCYHNSSVTNHSLSDSIKYISHQYDTNISDKYLNHHNSLPIIHPTLLPEYDETNLNSTLLNSTGSHAEEPVHGATFGKIVAFLALMTYVAAFGFSFGPVTWLVLSEIFPAAVKGRAIAFTTVLNWGTNLIISLTFLNIIDGVGVSMTFIIFSVICIISMMFIFIYVPETKGRSLEQISVDLKKRSPLAITAVKCIKLCSCCPTNNSRFKVTSVYSKVREETLCEPVG